MEKIINIPGRYPSVSNKIVIIEETDKIASGLYMTDAAYTFEHFGDGNKDIIAIDLEGGPMIGTGDEFEKDGEIYIITTIEFDQDSDGSDGTQYKLNFIKAKDGHKA